MAIIRITNGHRYTVSGEALDAALEEEEIWAGRLREALLNGVVYSEEKHKEFAKDMEEIEARLGNYTKGTIFDHVRSIFDDSVTRGFQHDLHYPQLVDQYRRYATRQPPKQWTPPPDIASRESSPVLPMADGRHSRVSRNSQVPAPPIKQKARPAIKRRDGTMPKKVVPKEVIHLDSDENINEAAPSKAIPKQRHAREEQAEDPSRPSSAIEFASKYFLPPTAPVYLPAPTDLVARLDASENDNRKTREDLTKLTQEVRNLGHRSQMMSLQNVDRLSQTVALQNIDRLLSIWDGTAPHKEWVTRGVHGVRSAEDEDVQRHGRIEAFAHEMRLHLRRAREAGLLVPRSDALTFPMDLGLQATGAALVAGNFIPVTPTVQGDPVVISAPVNSPSTTPATFISPVTAAPISSLPYVASPPVHVSPPLPPVTTPATSPTLLKVLPDTAPVVALATSPKMTQETPPVVTSSPKVKPVTHPKEDAGLAPPVLSSASQTQILPSSIPPLPLAAGKESSLPPIRKRSHPVSNDDGNKRQRI
jgi:hypothetical protein